MSNLIDIGDLTIREARLLAAQLASLSEAPNAPEAELGTVVAKKHPFIGRHCVVRTYSDGVHVGIVRYASGTEALLTNARRIWQWKGAFTLNEVAINGIESSSRLSVPVPEIYLSQYISMVPTTELARQTFDKCGS